MDNLLLLGKNIRKYRKKQNITQEKLAELCDIHRTYISEVELGKRNISIKNLVKISNALNVSITVLVKGIDNNKNN